MRIMSAMEAEFERDYIYKEGQNYEPDRLLEREQSYGSVCGLYTKEFGRGRAIPESKIRDDDKGCTLI